MQHNKKCKPENLFFSVSIIGIIIMFALLVIIGGEAMNIMGYGESRFGMLIYLMYIIIFIVAFTQVTNYIYITNKKWMKFILPFVFLLSYPFYGCAFERGNPVIYAMLFIIR